MKRNMTSTNYNDIMSFEESVQFYEMIWDRRFVGKIQEIIFT